MAQNDNTIIYIITSAAVGEGSTVISMCVCWSVCLPVCVHTQEPHVTKLSANVTYGYGLVLLSAVMLCISSFVNNIMFAHNGTCDSRMAYTQWLTSRQHEFDIIVRSNTCTQSDSL